MKKILICGDSYAADWAVKPTGEGWCNMLEKDFKVTNMAQKGASQYRIWLQLSSQNINDYDTVILCHTSPFRLYVETHPIHHTDILNKDCDLIYSDIEYHSKTNKELLSIKEFFEKYFDIGQAKFIHSLMCDKMIDYVSNHNNVIHMTGINWGDYYSIDNILDIHKRTNIGHTNHLNKANNEFVYNEVLKRIK